MPSTFDLAKFQGYGFPSPEDPNPIQMTGDALNRWNTYVKCNAIKASQATGVDVGIIGMWPFLEGEFVPFENCDIEHNVPPGVVEAQDDRDPNTQCYHWDGQWQVGLGLHPAYTHMFIQDAFTTMYGNSDTATVQKVGQQVFDNMASRHGVTITIVPNPFPSTPLDQIVTGALNGDLAMRNLLVHLMKDEAISTYMIARHFKDNIGVDSGLAGSMAGWGSYYNSQKIINYIKAVYDAQ